MYLLALLLVLAVNTHTYAGTVEDPDPGVWGYVIAEGSFRSLDTRWERFRWYLEATGRYRQSGQELNQSIIRPALGYALSDTLSVWQGYAWNVDYPKGADAIDENRIWQQLVWKAPTWLGNFMSRNRLEQRFVETGDDVGWRFRELLKLAYPLPRDWSVVVWDEIFVGINSPDWFSPAGIDKGLDQNRAFVGMGYNFGPQLRVEAGYMNQFLNRQPDNKLNHIALFSVFLTY